MRRKIDVYSLSKKNRSILMENRSIIRILMDFSNEMDGCGELDSNEIIGKIIPYVKKLKLQSKYTNGNILDTEEFILKIENGNIPEGEGCGYLLSSDGNKKVSLFCELEWLNDHKKRYPYVVWYNV